MSDVNKPIALGTKFKNTSHTPGNKFRTADNFVQLYRALAWTQGFDLHVGKDRSYSTLSCATHSNCSFTVTAVLTSASVANQPDYVLVSSTPFNASHNHDAPFLPLSLEAENLRRSTLAPNDPSLLTPPLLTAGELSSFLEALNPDLLAYFPLLESAGISPTMRLAELYDLGEKDFTESMDDVGMPLFAKVEIVSGVTRAGRRVSAGEGVWDGRPARGKKLARAMEWIESAIAQGAVAMQSTSGGGQSRL